MIEETQLTISDWADATFGVAPNNMRIAVRANEEMAELLRALSLDDRNKKAAEEIADVIIVLCRIARNLGVTIMDEVDKKMDINRQREWNLDGMGQGYHLRVRDVLEVKEGGG